MSIFSRLKSKKQDKENQSEKADVSALADKDKKKPGARVKEKAVVQTKQAEENKNKRLAVKTKVGTRTELNRIKQDRLENILIKPLITEKVSSLGSLNQYAFEVGPKANKIEIKKAVEQIYGIKPVKVNIVKMSGKSVRFGRSVSHRKARKKAIVMLKKGEKIEVYAGV